MCLTCDRIRLNHHPIHFTAMVYIHFQDVSKEPWVGVVSWVRLNVLLTQAMPPQASRVVGMAFLIPKFSHLTG